MNLMDLPARMISSTEAPKPVGPYSQAVESGGLIFLSGQIGLEAGATELVSGDVADQARTALKNLSSVLRAAGVGLEDVVRVGVYLRDMRDFAKFNEVYGEFFSSWAPARTTVGGVELPKGALVEVDAVARARR